MASPRTADMKENNEPKVENISVINRKGNASATASSRFVPKRLLRTVAD
jgi:hypothetical protein